MIPVFQPVPGRLVQQVQVDYTTRTSTAATFPIDDTTPQITEGAEVFTLAITPKSTSNRLFIHAFAMLVHDTATGVGVMCLFRDAVANALATTYMFTLGTTTLIPVILNFTELAPAASATTYRVRIGVDANNLYINRAASGNFFNSTVYSGMWIREYAP